ncbi:hypothetical protein [Klebsiella phage K64-1]|uniref:Uncharacterized protein n=1 Tax=Klebsiella phage K64-1 TaxID=1439894 RepID=A0A0A8J990_BPK64|nr:hypothetical protein ACQ27_gp213 [Klebsiella phage K64-1]BAQ02823.1 hypothetical protein [Klebsiella phage K64-1]
MKGKFFFKEKGKEIEIQEFDFEYVLNSLCKEYNRHSNKEYCYTVIVSRTYNSIGEPVFDVRTLNLKEIYYDNVRLCVYDLMMDKIAFRRPEIKNLPVPALQKEYQEWKEGKVKKSSTPVVVDIPFKELKRTEISSNDHRIPDIMSQFNVDSSKALKVLDWIVNLPVCTQEVTIKVQNISTRQLELNDALQQHSEYIHKLMNNLTSALETLFPLKPTFTQKLFGKQPVIKIEQSDLKNVMDTLKKAVQYDTTKFNGIDTMFSSLISDIRAMQDEFGTAENACDFAISTLEDNFEFELMKNRILKMSITNTSSEAALIGFNKKYRIDVDQMVDIQTTTIPWIIMRLQNQVGQTVDSETVDILKNLAYGKKDDK